MNPTSKILQPTLFLLLAVLLWFSAACSQDQSQQMTEACVPDTSSSLLAVSDRPFYLGFTRWPPAATLEAIAQMNRFIEEHADLTALHFDSGVPWAEALQDQPFHAKVMSDWQWARDAIPKTHKIAVSITPLNNSRNGIAASWGADTNMPLSEPWKSYPLNHPDVKTAYLNYAKRVVEYFKPDYLVIGIEVNVAITSNFKTWEAYQELHRTVYEQIKALHPDLPVFASIVISHLTGLDKGDPALQQKEITEILPYCDRLGLSAYPYGWSYYPTGKLDPIPENFFDPVLTFGKTLAITETGAATKNFHAFGIDYKFNEDYQTQYIDLLLKKAYQYHVEFVVNWASIDFDRLLESIPNEAREIGAIWAYTGLQRSDGCPKKALALWDAYLHLPYQE